MTLQTKLTLGSVAMVSLIVGLVAAVNFQNEVQGQFQTTRERAENLSIVATTFVRQSLDRQQTVPLPEALKDPDLASLLVKIITASHAILEVAVVGREGVILADSDPNRLGVMSPGYPPFEPIVTTKKWYEKLQILLRPETQYYQLEQKLGTSEQVPLLYVRVIIDPKLLRNDIIPTLQENIRIGVLSVIGAACITFLFSAVAFRRLGRIGQMLDLAARGEYEAEEAASTELPAGDELSVMASKVSLLGQRLRGAQFEVSDLRGNIDRLLQDLEDAVFIFERERRLVFASGTVEKFLGTARSSLSGKTVAEVFPPHTTMGLVIEQACEVGRPVRNRRVTLSPRPPAVSGPAYVLLSVDILTASNGAAAAGAGLLVRLRDPEAQRQIGRELQTADRLTALSRVSGGVAHEVKNPLNAILLHVEVARSKLARGDTDVAQQMEIVSREILRLDRVVKTFLDFTRPVELHFTNVELNELLSEILELARPQAESSQIQVRVDEDARGGEVRVDRDLLKQAFLNVVVNAIESMPNGGELRFESRTNSETAEIRISDTGPGIPPNIRDKIFLLYFTTKIAGSGIGLAMTFRIVQLHDGTIDFTSESGKGTTFSIRLPIAV